MKIASIQMDISWQDKQKNFAKAQIFIEQAFAENCSLIVFPEMFNSGFSMDSNAIAEPCGGETFKLLSRLAKQNQINIIAGFAEVAADKTENIAVFISKTGELLSRYVKNYPYTPSGENKVYEKGNQQVVFNLENTPASMFICYDLRFPELFRKVAKQVEIIFVIASWPVTRQDHWETLLKARAIENQCFIVGVNRIGRDGNKLQYGGGSHVYSPLGDDLSRGGSTQEFIVTELDITLVSKTRKLLPFLDDIKD